MKKALWIIALVCAFSLPIACGNSPSSPGGGSATFTLFNNGTWGCWANDCISGGVTYSPIADWPISVNGSNELVLSYDNSVDPELNCPAMEFLFMNPQNPTAYSGGSFRFDIKLATGISYVSVRAQSYMGGTANSLLNLGALSTSSFTPVTLSLGTITTTSLYNLAKFTVCAGTLPTGTYDLLYVNNIKYIAP